MTVLSATYNGAHNPHERMSCKMEGEAWCLSWQFAQTDRRQLEGVGIVLGQTLFAGRTTFQQGHDTTSPGIVVYKRDINGDLAARWYHPDLQGKLGEGRSLEGPSKGYVGTYRAEYASQSESFEPLIKEITRNGSAYHFEWRTRREVVYIGIGIEYGPNLVAAWSTPREALDVAVYDLRSLPNRVSGKAVSHQDPEGRLVSEHWRDDG